MQKAVPIILAVLAILALGYLFMNYNEMPSHTQSMRNSPMMNSIENFANTNSTPDMSNPEYVAMMNAAMKSKEQFADVPEQQVVSGSEEMGYNEQPQSIGFEQTGSQMNQLPSECYPKDVLSSADLLPRDANSLWAQVSPSGQGSLADQNFLTSGFHIGINTVGQTLRNANRQLRSEPLNPQVKVSPWMQTTIDPDINRRPLEINSGDL